MFSETVTRNSGLPVGPGEYYYYSAICICTPRVTCVCYPGMCSANADKRGSASHTGRPNLNPTNRESQLIELLSAAGHGVSVLECARNVPGQWLNSPPSRTSMMTSLYYLAIGFAGPGLDPLGLQTRSCCSGASDS